MPDSEPAPETPEELAGPRYALGEQFSKGGMGGLWYARESATGRTIALKRILGRPDAESFRRFLNEARITARLEHPNIVPVHGLGTDPDGHPFYTMKLVQGTDLAGVLKKLAKGDPETVARYPLAQLLIIFQKVCDAVAFAHSHRVIHRDLKPANIMLGPFGEVLVMDWGLAKDLSEPKASPASDTPGKSIASLGPLPDDNRAAAPETEPLPDDERATVARPEPLPADERVTLPAEPDPSPDNAGVTLPGRAFGSPHYMAPEQARGDIHLHEPRTDIYSLGAVLYQILALRRPVSGTTAGAILARVIDGDLDPLLLPRRDAAADEDADLPPEQRRPKLPRLELRHLPESVIPESLAAVVLRAMAFAPEKRYQSVPELQREITAYQNGFATGAERAGLGKQILLALRRNRREATVAGIALLLLLALAVVSFLRIRLERDLADEQRQRAEAAAIQARENLSQSDFLQALRSIEDHLDRDAVAQLARSVSSNPGNNPAIFRLTTLLMYQSFALPVWYASHDAAVRSARFSPDGQLVVTASEDHTARIWDAQNGKPRNDPLKHDAEIWSAHFSPDGNRIVTASLDRTARVWDAKSGKPLTGPFRHYLSVTSAQFSPDGKRILTASSGRRTEAMAQVWNAESGVLIATVENIDRGDSAEFSPDGKRIVTMSRVGTVDISDAQSGKRLSELKHDSWVKSALFSSHGKWIVTVSKDHARVWDVQSGKLLIAPVKHDGIVSAQFSPDAKQIVTASYDGTVRILDAQSGKLLTESFRHDGGVQSAQFSPDGKRVVTASSDNTARVWDTQSDEPLAAPLRHGDEIGSAEFSPNAKLVLTASIDGTARVWNTQSGKLLTESLGSSDDIQWARAESDRIIRTARKAAVVWWEQRGYPKADEGVSSANSSPDGKRIVTASRDWTARIWDVQSGKLLTAPLMHDQAVESAQFDSSGKWVVTASGNNARVWDAQSGKPLIEPLKHVSRVLSARFSPDGKSIVTVLEDKTVRVWEMPPIGKNPPKWFPHLAEAVAGQQLNDRGFFEPLREDPIQVIEELRAQLSRAPADDAWAIWGRWFLADRSTRTISPFSKITVPEYIEKRIKENTPASLDEAESLAVGNADFLKRIANARAKLENQTPAHP
jgi:WD40 repeat protein/serine/threonine protein kinase